MIEVPWFTAAEIAARRLPTMPRDESNVRRMAERGDWQRAAWEGKRWRFAEGRGGGVEYHFSVLPWPAQAALLLGGRGTGAGAARVNIAPPAAGATPVATAGATPVATAEDAERNARWAWFERLPERKQAVARDRLEALVSVQLLVEHGMGRVLAMGEVGRLRGVRLSTLYNWTDLVLGVPRHDWLAHLAPHHVGRTGDRAACDPAAWEFLKADWLRPERPSFTACHRRLLETAAAQGWALPAPRTLERRLDAIPQSLRVLARDGQDGLKRMLPAQQRDRAALHALAVVNADGHKWDVFVRWPDGAIARPMMIAFQDIHSGKILAWRVDRSENKEAFRLCFGDMVEEHGIPDACVLDNSRSFASKWMTGGTANRFRFKIKDDDPLGVMTQMGVAIHWATPYAGQSKPIERAFRDFAGDTAKHPAFAGAYTGNSPTAKPDNYASSAVPLELFLATVGQGVIEHNARPGRTGGITAGRSFDAVFQASYTTSLIRRASAHQRRLWLLAAERVLVSRTDGSITLAGNRYWDEFLHNLRGERVPVARRRCSSTARASAPSRRMPGSRCPKPPSWSATTRPAARSPATTPGTSPVSCRASRDEHFARADKMMAYPMSGVLPAVFLPYQQRFMAAIDAHSVVVWEKSRRTGFSWAAGAVATLKAGATRAAGGSDVLYMGYNLEMAREFIDYVGEWATRLGQAASAMEEVLFPDPDDPERQIKAFRVNFASGFKVLALPSVPRALRGMQGLVIIDEAAFHDDLEALLKAAFALLIWGGRVVIISTHDGDTNPFATLVQDIRAGRRPYFLGRTTFDEALEDGLYRRICLTTGQAWSADGEQTWRAGIIAQYGAAADEELHVIPSPSTGTFIPAPLIEARGVAGIPVLRWECDRGFAMQPERQREAACAAWLADEVAPVLARLDRTTPHAFGWDMARHGDLSVFWLLAIGRDLVRRTPFVIELRGVPFAQQQQVLWFVIALLRLRAGAMDATGLGMDLAERTAQRFGSVILQVTLSETWYRAEMPPLKAAFEDAMLEIPWDRDIHTDLRQVKLVRGIARVPDRTRDDRNLPRHGDAAIALALAWFASRAEPEVYDYEAAGRRSPTTDSAWRNPDADDDDVTDFIMQRRLVA